MKKILQTIIIFSILAINTALVFGQGRTLNKEEYNKITQKAFGDLQGKPYRGIFTSEFFDDRNSSPTETTKSISEFVPPDRYHWTIESKNLKRETIIIGSKKYYRLNNGEWTDKEEMLTQLSSGNSSGIPRDSSEVYKVFEDVKLNGKKINLYEKITKLTNFSTENKGTTKIWTSKIWISKDGIILKLQDEYETIGKKSLQRSITVYEYDPNIKIEAPKTASEKP